MRIVLDSLYAAWAAHAAWNWIMAVPFHASVSGISFDAPDYRTVSHGPAWATGGGWGPEGGVAAAVGMLAGLFYSTTERGVAARSRDYVTDRIAVIGAGQMGNGIAHVFAQAGFRVTMIDVGEGALARGRATIEKNLDSSDREGHGPGERAGRRSSSA